MIVADEEANRQLVRDGVQHTLRVEAVGEDLEVVFVGEGQEDAPIGDRRVDAGRLDGARGHFDAVIRTVERGGRTHEQIPQFGKITGPYF